jgi:hypothetical protein
MYFHKLFCFFMHVVSVINYTPYRNAFDKTWRQQSDLPMFLTRHVTAFGTCDEQFEENW